MGNAFLGSGSGSPSVIRNKVDGAVSDARIAMAVAEYMAKNPVTGAIGFVELPADKWDGNDNRFSQVVQVLSADGVTPYPITEFSQVDLTPTGDQLEEFYGKPIAFVAENAKCVVTVSAIGYKPVNDHTFQVTVKEVRK